MQTVMITAHHPIRHHRRMRRTADHPAAVTVVEAIVGTAAVMLTITLTRGGAAGGEILLPIYLALAYGAGWYFGRKRGRQE